MTDPSRPPAAARPLRLGFVVALLLVACGGSLGTTGGSERGTGTPAPPSSGAPSSTAPGAASGALTDPAEGALPFDPATPVSCHGLAEIDCATVLGAVLPTLPSGTAPVVYAEVGPFWCPAQPGCEPSVIARPAGRVFLELAGADPIELSVERGPDGTFGVQRGEAFTVLVDPSSPASGIAGPVELDLGHCGLLSGIDLDGSWWDPVGFVDSDHGDAINAAHGTVAFQGPNEATFTSDNGLVVALERRAGAKHLPLCQ